MRDVTPRWRLAIAAPGGFTGRLWFNSEFCAIDGMGAPPLTWRSTPSRWASCFLLVTLKRPTAVEWLLEGLGFGLGWWKRPGAAALF